MRAWLYRFIRVINKMYFKKGVIVKNVKIVSVVLFLSFALSTSPVSATHEGVFLGGAAVVATAAVCVGHLRKQWKAELCQVRDHNEKAKLEWKLSLLSRFEKGPGHIMNFIMYLYWSGEMSKCEPFATAIDGFSEELFNRLLWGSNLVFVSGAVSWGLIDRLTAQWKVGMSEEEDAERAHRIQLARKVKKFFAIPATVFGGALAGAMDCRLDPPKQLALLAATLLPPVIKSCASSAKRSPATSRLS